MDTRREHLEDRPDIHESRMWQTENILSSLRSSLNSRTVFRRSYHDPDEYIQVAGENQQIASPSKSPLDWPLRNSPFPKEWNDPNSSLPPFDRSLRTREASIGVLVVSALAAAGCFAYSIYIYAARPSIQIDHVNLGTAAREVVTLAVLTVLAFITDQLSYIHSTSLRWALYSEGRLGFNTNIRLFTSSKHSLPNSWFVNMLSIFFLVLSFAAAAQLFIQFWLSSSELGQQIFINEPTAINITALFALGIGLLGQTIIGVFCIIQPIPSWSANPLNTTLAALHAGTIHNPGRCMLPVHDRAAKSGAYKPTPRQSSAWNTKISVRWVFAFIWVLGILSLIPIPAWAIVERVEYPSARISLTNTPLGFFISPSQNNPIPSFHTVVQGILALLLFCGLQGLQTMGLHCAELLVNMARDESCWRRAALPRSDLGPDVGAKQSMSRGTHYQTSPFAAAATSWQNAILFFMKAVMHFLFSQTVALASVPVEDFSAADISFDADGAPSTRSLAFVVRLPFALAYGGSALLVALFVTYLAFRCPKGPQPAAFGHIQTLADLIDDWSTNSQGRFWWGGKNANRDGTRHAGMSANPDGLSRIQTDELYA